MTRKIMAVIAGYFVFALSAGLWFPFMGYPPHNNAPLAFKLETLAYGVFFSLLAGWLTKKISRAPGPLLNYLLAALMFTIALFSLLFSSGSHWTQWMTLLIFAPCAFFGGRLFRPDK